MKLKNNGALYWLTLGNKVIEFMRNGRWSPEENLNNVDIMCIRVRSRNDEDDVLTDYCAGTWCDNLKQALSLAQC